MMMHKGKMRGEILTDDPQNMKMHGLETPANKMIHLKEL